MKPCQKKPCTAAATTLPKVWLTDGTKRLGVIIGLATCDEHPVTLDQVYDREHFPQWSAMATMVGHFEAVFELTTVELIPVDGDEAAMYFRMQARSRPN